MGSDSTNKPRRTGRVISAIAFTGSFGLLFYLLASTHSERSVPERPYDAPSTLRGSSIASPGTNALMESVSITWPERVTAYTPAAVQHGSLLDIIQRWNPDIMEPPLVFTETLQHFNYSCPVERAVAAQFLEAEMPFKVYNVPEFDDVSARWTDDYLIRNIKNAGRVERAETNHFMFWNGRSRGIRDFNPPTEVVEMRFPEFLRRAHAADKKNLSSEAEHFYFTMGVSKQDKRTFIGQDLSLFSTKQNNFFIRDATKNKGIQCRFGMRGVSAAAHYDAGRNMVAVLRGYRRYIITPPRTCKSLGIITDKRHPSFRHSILDWSSVPQAIASGFDKVDAIDTIIKPGEVLYIPSYWFHYIVSLGYSAQCNSRHGSPADRFGKVEIDECFGNQK